ncbi:MAG: hypothetical protein NT005_05850 [Spirochaetes bacterium]|nr:hypothetical protein [Spirochaetota bacterium]
MKVVSNTTTLIAFLGLGKLSILKDLFGKLIIPKAVHDELSRKTTPSLEEWIEVIEINGESEALCLCQQIGADVILPME